MLQYNSPFFNLGDTAYYTIRQPTFGLDNAQNDGFQCGIPGQSAGLMFLFVKEEFSVPYGKEVELYFGVGGGQESNQFINLCEQFVDVELQIIATCEIPTPSSKVYQYGFREDPFSLPGAPQLSYDIVLGALNDTSTFSVSWPPDSAKNYYRKLIEKEMAMNESTYPQAHKVLLEMIRTQNEIQRLIVENQKMQIWLFWCCIVVLSLALIIACFYFKFA